MLVPTSSSWRGTVGLCFTTPADFQKYLNQISFTSWRPSNVCLHNTGAPTLDQWNATVAGPDVLADAKQRMLNLTGYYRDEEKWLGGPHLFITDKLICVFNPLDQRGTHSPNFNATHWGVEMVGDFDAEPFNPAIRSLSCAALGIMFAKLGVNPRVLNFHKDDPEGHQDCPGHNVLKADVIQGVLSYMSGGDANGHDVTPTTPPVPPAQNSLAWVDPAIKTPIVGELQDLLNRLGVATPALVVDEWLGHKTLEAIDVLRAKVSSVL